MGRHQLFAHRPLRTMGPGVVSAPLAATLRAIADGLNAKGIPTARGSGEWTATQVARLLERLATFREGQAA
jgi:hypothetical protein